MCAAGCEISGAVSRAAPRSHEYSKLYQGLKLDILRFQTSQHLSGFLFAEYLNFRLPDFRNRQLFGLCRRFRYQSELDSLLEY